MRETCRLPTTPQNHTPRSQPQCAKHAACRPRHSARPTVTRPFRIQPRPSRTLSTSFLHPPTSFPRRRESACPCETTAFRFLPNRHPQQEPMPNPPSTEIDTMRQDSAEYNENSCPRGHAHARARHSRHGGRRWVVQRPRGRGAPPRHSRTLSTSFPHPPTSFPRRRESARPCDATGVPFLSQSPRAARADTKLAVDGNRHNATEFYEPQRKLVPAREASLCCASPAQCVRPALKPVIPILNPVRPVPTHVIPVPTTSFPHPPTSVPHPPTSFPRRRESPRPQQSGRIARSRPSPSSIDQRTEPVRRAFEIWNRS